MDEELKSVNVDLSGDERLKLHGRIDRVDTYEDDEKIMISNAKTLIREYDGRQDNNVGVVDWPCKPFMLPNGMTREECFKVLSYLTDFIETGTVENKIIPTVVTSRTEKTFE